MARRPPRRHRTQPPRTAGPPLRKPPRRLHLPRPAACTEEGRVMRFFLSTRAAPQDWMCEPFMVSRSGMSVTEHQTRTVASFAELRGLAPDLPFMPVLQGWTVAEYLRCAGMY